MKFKKKIIFFHRWRCWNDSTMRLHYSKDGSTYSGYKLMCFVYIHWSFYIEQNTLAFNRDKWCHLALCLLMILLHWVTSFSSKLAYGLNKLEFVHTKCFQLWKLQRKGNAVNSCDLGHILLCYLGHCCELKCYLSRT